MSLASWFYKSSWDNNDSTGYFVVLSDVAKYGRERADLKRIMIRYCFVVFAMLLRSNADVTPFDVVNGIPKIL
jgi:hypothetical protein